MHELVSVPLKSRSHMLTAGIQPEGLFSLLEVFNNTVSDTHVFSPPIQSGDF